MKKFKPTKVKLNPKLSQDELELEESLARGEWEPVSREERDALGAELKQAALEHMKKEARVNIRMSPKILDQIKQIAAQEGLPYQTLMSSVLHKFATGRLVDGSALDAIGRKLMEHGGKTRTKKVGL